MDLIAYIRPNSLCNKRHELVYNFLSLILIDLVPKVASNCEIMQIHRVAR